MCSALQITINRPERRNAFTPQTTQEMMRCFDDARDDPRIGVVILTGVTFPQYPKMGLQVSRYLPLCCRRVVLPQLGCHGCRFAGEGTEAFCSGGDQGVRGEGGYVGPDKIPRLNVLDLQVTHFGLSLLPLHGAGMPCAWSNTLDLHLLDRMG